MCAKVTVEIDGETCSIKHVLGDIGLLEPHWDLKVLALLEHRHLFNANAGEGPFAAMGLGMAPLWHHGTIVLRAPKKKKKTNGGKMPQMVVLEA